MMRKVGICHSTWDLRSSRANLIDRMFRILQGVKLASRNKEPFKT